MTHIPIERWGKDHWSTFAYAACRVVSNAGKPDFIHMRCDADRHPGYLGSRFSDQTVLTKKYPTWLKGDKPLKNHDDWDCIEDAEAAGLLTIGGTGLYPVWGLTGKGWTLAKEITKHENAGGTFANFVPTELLKK